MSSHSHFNGGTEDASKEDLMKSCYDFNKQKDIFHFIKESKMRAPSLPTHSK